jgi:hypothetical protein
MEPWPSNGVALKRIYRAGRNSKDGSLECIFVIYIIKNVLKCQSVQAKKKVLEAETKL